jgi:hypothetical protein
VLYWLIPLIALTILPVILRLWADDEPRRDDPPDSGSDEEGPDLPLAA